MNNKVLNNYIELFWIFLYGSFAGFLYENILTILKGQWSLRQGLVYGPLIPVYGVGMIVFYLVARKLNITKQTNKKYLFAVFLSASFLGGLVEYIFSFLQEKIWGTISWNYADLMFNINGRTSLFIAFIWGFAFIIFSLYLLPMLRKHKELLSKKTMMILTCILSVMLFFDCSISFAATYRQKERKENLEPSNKIEVYLDEHYPDEYLNRIYNNAVEVTNLKK